MLTLQLHVLTHSVEILSEYRELLRLCAERNIGLNISDQVSNNVNISLDNIRGYAEDLGLPVTLHLADKVVEARAAAVGSVPVSGPEIAAVRNSIKELLRAFRKETEGRRALLFEPGRAEFYNPPGPLFGEAVSLKFAKVSADIDEAGKCYALDRPTACVFHLMRVVEHAVQRLGKKLRIPIDVGKEGWYQITIHVNKAVDALPSGTARQRRVKQEYGSAAAHLNTVRIATRNDVMHPKATYTGEEAQTLFEATKALMRQMAKLV